VVLHEDGLVLSQQLLFLHLDNGLDSLLLRDFSFAVPDLDFSLLFVDKQLLLPQAFDLAFVFKLPHAALLGIHLLKSLVLGEFLHQLGLEVLFDTFLLSLAFSLKSHLEILSLLELHADAITLLYLSSLPSDGSFFTLLIVKFVAEVILEFPLSTALHFFCLKSFEDLVTCLFSSVLSSLNLVQTLLLLGSVLSHHLIFVLFHLLSATLQSSFFIDRQDHVSLGLLHLQLGDVGHLAVLIDHLLDHVVNLLFLFKVLLVSLFFESLALLNLGLNSLVVLFQGDKFLGVVFSLDFFLIFSFHELVLIHRSIVFLKNQL